MVTFVPLLEAFFVRGEKLSKIPSREASGAAGLKVMAAGRRLCERRGYYCYKFHHLSQNGRENFKGEAVEEEGERSSCPVSYYFSLRVLFQLRAILFSQVTV